MNYPTYINNSAPDPDPKPTPVENPNPTTPEIEPTVPPTTGVPPIKGA